jgi:FkbM family methyltransferase
MTRLPLNHYKHLERLALLRRCSIENAISFLIDNVDPVKDNWLDERFGTTTEEREVDLKDRDIPLLMTKIQGLPRNIRPLTDGPYLSDFSFFTQEQGLIGINADGVKILDFEMATVRDRDVYRLVKDLLPKMTEEQFRVYNTFNSQHLFLVREPDLMTMPRIPASAIDAGCYVGYKALAMARFTEGQPVLAFELDTDNYEVLKLNAQNNPAYPIIPIHAALSDNRTEVTLHTRNRRTMAHSLTSFDRLTSVNTPLLREDRKAADENKVVTTLLDDYTQDIDKLSAVHISVNGHEPEVLAGGIQTARKADILSISCPYSRDGRSLRDEIIRLLKSSGIRVFGTCFAAVIAGRKKGMYTAIPVTRLGYFMYRASGFPGRMARRVKKYLFRG